MKHSHYKKDVRHLDMIDPYRICDLWNITNPAQQHALKKVLLAGRRGLKDFAKDVQEAIDSLLRLQDMIAEDAKAAPEMLALQVFDPATIKRGPLLPVPAVPFDPLPPVGLGIKSMHPDARMPTYATDGSACFDLYACDVDEGSKPHPRDPHAYIFRTGLAFDIPEGWKIEIYSRSGQGFKDAVRLSNAVGVIDHDYKNEVMVSLRFDGSDELRCPKVSDGDRIAQACLVPVHKADFHWVDDIVGNGRGGFGSTGR